MIKITDCLSINDPADDDENGCVEIFDSITKGSIYVLPSDIPPLMAHLTKRAADWLIWSVKEWFLAKIARR